MSTRRVREKSHDFSSLILRAALHYIVQLRLPVNLQPRLILSSLQCAVIIP